METSRVTEWSLARAASRIMRSMTESFDLLIHGGTVVDGSGAPGYPADVAVIGDRLRVLPRSVGARSGPHGWRRPGGRTIDATGLVVAPGFIDLHSHAGLTMLAEPRHEPKVRQGVTTEVIGVDGNSYAPFTNQGDLDDFLTLNAGLDGRPDIDADWRTVGDYLDRFDRRVSVNVAYLIGNSALRIAAIGWDDVPADAKAMDRQRGLLREGMEDGAFGLSSGLDYPPGAYATTDELATLLVEASRLGGIYHTHVRYDLGDRFLDPFREAIEIGRRSGGGPVHITHFYHRRTFPGTPEQMLGPDRRRARRRPRRDLRPLPLGVGQHAAPDHAAALDPGRRRGAAQGTPLGPGRARTGSGTSWPSVAGRMPGRTPGPTCVSATSPDPSTLAGRAARWPTTWPRPASTRRTPSATCSWPRTCASTRSPPGPHKAGMIPFWQHPVSMVGTDGVMIADKPAPRTYGSFPRILGEFVREDRLTSLEEAVRKMTSAPAARLGLVDRGLLRDGLKADIVVFDPVTVRSLATYDDPRRFPLGIPHVVVNGQLVVHDGEHTGALPGRALRRGRPTD